MINHQYFCRALSKYKKKRSNLESVENSVASNLNKLSGTKVMMGKKIFLFFLEFA